MRYLLDTHIWIWWHTRPGAIPARIIQIIRAGKYDELLLSIISVWELAKLVEKRRITLATDVAQWVDEALAMPKFRIVPLEPEIAIASTQLPQPFHDDPADQIIVATARRVNATVITVDRLISNYPHIRSLAE